MLAYMKIQILTFWLPDAGAFLPVFFVVFAGVSVCFLFVPHWGCLLVVVVVGESFCFYGLPFLLFTVTFSLSFGCGVGLGVGGFGVGAGFGGDGGWVGVSNC